MEYLRQSMAMAENSVGMSGTRMTKTLEGRCVTTMVSTSPMLSASRAAKSALRPASRLHTNTMEPIFEDGVPYCLKNQPDTMDCDGHGRR